MLKEQAVIFQKQLVSAGQEFFRIKIKRGPTNKKKVKSGFLGRKQCLEKLDINI